MVRSTVEVIIERYLCYHLKCQAQLPNGDTIRNFVLKSLKIHPSQDSRKGWLRAMWIMDLWIEKKIYISEDPCVIFVLALMITHKMASDYLIPQAVWVKLFTGYVTCHELSGYERTLLKSLGHNLDILGMTENLPEYEREVFAFWDEGGLGDRESKKYMTSGNHPYIQPNAPQAVTYPAAHAGRYGYPNCPRLPHYGSGLSHNSMASSYSYSYHSRHGYVAVEPPKVHPQQPQLWLQCCNAELYYAMHS